MVGAKLDRAWAKEDPALALAALKAVANSLETDHPGAAGSLREGMEETLTVSRLGLPSSLLRTLSSTNPIESAFSGARTTMRNVKRWRSGQMVLRWTAAGMEVAAEKFRRVKGYREMPILVEKLKAHAAELSAERGKVA